MVTINVAGASLEEVLQEISAPSRIRVVLYDFRPEPISAAFQAVPLEEAVRRLVQGNFLLLYGPHGDLEEVWVWRAPDARSVAGERESLESLIEELAGGRAGPTTAGSPGIG